MHDSDDPRLLSALLSHRVLVLSNTLALAASRYYPRRFAVRLSEWRVIDALHAGGAISANRISQWLMTDKAWVSRSVERLIEGGYVRRSADPGHGRRLLLRLTAKGQRAYASIAAAARQRNDNLLACLTGTQQQALQLALARLEARAAAMLAQPHLGFEPMEADSGEVRGRRRRST